MKAGDRAVRTCFDNTKLGGILLFHRNRGDRHLRAFLFVKFDHLPDIHSVNMIGAEDDHEVRVRLFDQIINRLACFESR